MATDSDGMIAKVRDSAANLMNFHNQGVLRAEFHSANRTGFTVEFLGAQAQRALEDGLGRGVVSIIESSVTAAVQTSDQLKQKLRTYLDGHFQNSAEHGNDHRRASNAMVQSYAYNDFEQKGQFTARLYSKFGAGHGPSTFVDWLLLHVRGGTLTPRSGEWLRITNKAEDPAGLAAVGNFGATRVFWAKSADGEKLFLLRRYKGSGKTTLLATLVRSLEVPPSLAGLDDILTEAGALFERNLESAWSRGAAKAGLN